VDNRAANIIKQELLAAGGEAAVNWKVGNYRRGTGDVVIMATPRQLERVLEKFAAQPFGLAKLAGTIRQALANHEREAFKLVCGRHTITLGSVPVVMGILNVTPDSFSDAGAYADTRRAVERGLQMAFEGAASLMSAANQHGRARARFQLRRSARGSYRSSVS